LAFPGCMFSPHPVFSVSMP